MEGVGGGGVILPPDRYQMCQVCQPGRGHSRRQFGVICQVRENGAKSVESRTPPFFCTNMRDGNFKGNMHVVYSQHVFAHQTSILFCARLILPGATEPANKTRRRGFHLPVCILYSNTSDKLSKV